MASRGLPDAKDLLRELSIELRTLTCKVGSLVAFAQAGMTPVSGICTVVVASKVWFLSRASGVVPSVFDACPQGVAVRRFMKLGFP